MLNSNSYFHPQPPDGWAYGCVPPYSTEVSLFFKRKLLTGSNPWHHNRVGCFCRSGHCDFGFVHVRDRKLKVLASRKRLSPDVCPSLAEEVMAGGQCWESLFLLCVEALASCSCSSGCLNTHVHKTALPRLGLLKKKGKYIGKEVYWGELGEMEESSRL